MSIQQPCKRWQQLLAARHPDDLTATERATLEQHLATCAACTVTRADYDMLTQRIRALPAPSAQPLPQFAMPQQEAKTISKHPELDSLPLPERLSSRPRRSRFARTTNVLAATLLLVALIGSSLILFSHRPRTSTGVPASAKAEPTHLIPQPLGSCLSDPGLDKICTEGYYKLVHITQKFNGPQDFTLTINRLYADSNRIVVGYTLLDSHGNVPDGLLMRRYYVSFFLSKLNGNTHSMVGGGTDGFYGIEGSEGSVNVKTDQKKFTGMMFTTFDEPQYIPYAAQQIPTGTKELSLHLQAALYFDPSTDTQPATQGVTTTQPVDLGRAYFDVTMPFHQGNVLHPHTTPTGQGVSDLSIDYIVVSLSETYIQLDGNQTITVMDDHSNKVSTVLSINGTKSYVGWDSWVNGNKYYESLFQQPLYNEHGTWKLQITVHNPSGKVIKSVLFTFTYS